MKFFGWGKTKGEVKERVEGRREKRKVCGWEKGG